MCMAQPTAIASGSFRRTWAAHGWMSFGTDTISSHPAWFLRTMCRGPVLRQFNLGIRTREKPTGQYHHHAASFIIIFFFDSVRRCLGHHSPITRYQTSPSIINNFAIPGVRMTILWSNSKLYLHIRSGPGPGLRWSHPSHFTPARSVRCDVKSWTGQDAAQCSKSIS